MAVHKRNNCIVLSIQPKSRVQYNINEKRSNKHVMLNVREIEN